MLSLFKGPNKARQGDGYYIAASPTFCSRACWLALNFTMNKDLRKIWREVTELLSQARAILNNCDGSVDFIDDKQFIEYLEYNELGLALDEIEAISDSFELPKEF